MAIICKQSVAAPDPLEIMKKNEAARKINEYFTSAEMTVTRTGEAPKKKKFKIWRKIKADQVRFQAVTQFLDPAEVKGQAILFQENASGLNDISMYLPAYKKVRRVESSQQSGSFMGSDFSYSDLTQQHVEDYRYKYLGEEACGKGKCFKIEALPGSDDVKERTGYTKSLFWIDQTTFLANRTEFFDLTGKQSKVITADKTDKLGGALYFSRDLTVKHLTQNSSTHLLFAPLKLSVGVEDAFFTVQNFAKLK
jgi:hypothetical protein